jgi:hypothetical protein
MAQVCVISPDKNKDMKKIKQNLIKLTACAFIITALPSCSGDSGYADYDTGSSPTQNLNGEWFVDIIDEASGEVLVQHILHRTYDTGKNDDKMFINDYQEGYYLGGTVNTNPANLTFSVTDEPNFNDALDDDGVPTTTFSITDGKILKNAAHSKAGNVVDSIYFKGTFSYDPETIVIFSGHKRTGFDDDEY